MRGTLQVISTELRRHPSYMLGMATQRNAERPAGRGVLGKPPVCKVDPGQGSEEVDCSCSDWARQSMTRRSPRSQPSQKGTTARPALTNPDVHGGSQARTHNLLRFTPAANSPSAHEGVQTVRDPAQQSHDSVPTSVIRLRSDCSLAEIVDKETAVPCCDPGDTVRVATLRPLYEASVQPPR